MLQPSRTHMQQYITPSSLQRPPLRRPSDPSLQGFWGCPYPRATTLNDTCRHHRCACCCGTSICHQCNSCSLGHPSSRTCSHDTCCPALEHDSAPDTSNNLLHTCNHH